MPACASRRWPGSAQTRATWSGVADQRRCRFWTTRTSRCRARAIAALAPGLRRTREARRRAGQALEATAGRRGPARTRAGRALCWPLTRRPRRSQAEGCIAYLGDPADEVRHGGGAGNRGHRGRAALADDLRPELQQPMSVLLADPVQRVRQAALTILGRLGTREANAALLEALDDDSPDVRVQAADALVAAGKPAISLVHPRLSSPDAAHAQDGRRDSRPRRSQAVRRAGRVAHHGRSVVDLPEPGPGRGARTVRRGS